MKTMMKLSLLMIASAMFTCGSYAQQNILSAGSSDSGTDGSITWSVGQVAYSTTFRTTGSVSEGVQQPYEIFTIGIDEKETLPDCRLFPNPTSGKLILAFDKTVPEHLDWQITTTGGVMLDTGVICSKEEILSLDEFTTGIYFIAILKNDQPVKVYKIVKR
jgi:hypothetical protein